MTHHTSELEDGRGLGGRGGREDEQAFTQGLNHGFWVSNPLLLFFCQLLPCREWEIFLQVGQGCVYPIVANYMVNTDPPGLRQSPSLFVRLIRLQQSGQTFKCLFSKPYFRGW